MTTQARIGDQLIPRRNREWLLPLDGIKSCLELGNKKEPNAKGTYKDQFERWGIHHVSVDLNGEDGALPLDLREPLNLGTYDLVTNFGTTEHVSEQEPVWRNIAEACDKLLVSVTPMPGLYPDHGIWYPTPAFYFDFARLNGFHIERYAQKSRDRNGLRVNLHVRMRRKVRVPFVMPDRRLIVREAMKDRYSERIIPRNKEILCTCGLWPADHPCVGSHSTGCDGNQRQRSPLTPHTSFARRPPTSFSRTDGSTNGTATSPSGSSTQGANSRRGSTTVSPASVGGKGTKAR